MNFALICRDGPNATESRLAARTEHLENIHRMKAQGSIIDGGAMLDENGQMIGSIVLCSFPDRATLGVYLSNEVYVRLGVWQDIEIVPFRRVNWEGE